MGVLYLSLPAVFAVEILLLQVIPSCCPDRCFIVVWNDSQREQPGLPFTLIAAFARCKQKPPSYWG